MIRNVHVCRLTPAEKAHKPLCQWPVSDKLRARLKERGRTDLQWSCKSPAEYLFTAEWWSKRALVNVQEDIVCTAHAAEFARKTGVPAATLWSRDTVNCPGTTHEVQGARSRHGFAALTMQDPIPVLLLLRLILLTVSQHRLCSIS